MATEFNFNGRLVKLPGVYSRITSGVTNAPIDLDFGNVLIFDTDAASTFGGGSGVRGQDTQGEDSVYTFNNITDFRSFVRGGEQYDLAEPLFRPFGSFNGASNIIYVRALSTVAATASYTFTGGGGNGGTFTIASKHEGLCGNGAIVNDELQVGLAVQMEVSAVDNTRFVLRFYRGTFTGNDSNGVPFNNITAPNSTAELLATSAPFNTMAELQAWFNTDISFRNNFKVTTFTPAGTGAITMADLTSNDDLTAFTGGTQTSDANSMSDAFETIAELDYSFILAPDSGAQYNSATNSAILSHLKNEARFEKVMIVGGGEDINDFASTSIAAAQFFNSDRVVVVHGGIEVSDPVSGTREKDAKYKAALVMGRILGIEPQTNPAFKGVNYVRDKSPLNRTQRVRALDAGVLTTNFDRDIGSFVITQGINTLQNNRNLVNEDGTSFSISLRRIAAQLNKGIEINAKIDLLGNQRVGANRATLSPTVVESWTKAYLQRQTATTTADNLIIRFQNIVVNINQDAYEVQYQFEPNTEINKLFFTGVIIDPNL